MQRGKLLMKRPWSLWIDVLFVVCITAAAVLLSREYIRKSARKIAQSLRFEPLQNDAISSTPSPLFYKSIGGPADTAPETQVPQSQYLQPKYSVELFVCKSQECARNKLEEFKQVGLRRVFYTPVKKGDGPFEYRIRKGIYHTQSGAQIAHQNLAELYKLHGAIIKL